MLTFEYAGEPLATLRSHPWTDAVGNASARYYDLKAHPERIRTSLEDFAPFQDTVAVQRFYALIEWLNGPSCVLESNDCAFSPPYPNENPQFDKKFECSGRLMVLFRDLPLNRSPTALADLTYAFQVAASQSDPGFAFGAVGASIVPVRYLALPAGTQRGAQLMLSLWAWGDTEAETMDHLARLMSSLAGALQQAASSAS